MINLKRLDCPNSQKLKTNYKFPENKMALLQSTFNKCMYCESEISSTQFGDVEHIKPKSKFPKLTFSWDNLGIACTRCNNAKKDKWPSCGFINPFDEDPSNAFVFNCIVSPFQSNARAKMSIQEIDLNRLELIEARMDLKNHIDSKITEWKVTKNNDTKDFYFEGLKNLVQSKNKFSAFVKSYLKQQQII